LKVNDLHDIIVYYVRVNQDKEVNMQHPKDVKGSDKSLLSIPVGQRYTTILARLDAIELEIKYMKESIEDLDNSYHDIEIRIEKLEEMTDGIN